MIECGFDDCVWCGCDDVFWICWCCCVVFFDVLSVGLFVCCGVWNVYGVSVFYVFVM